MLCDDICGGRRVQEKNRRFDTPGGPVSRHFLSWSHKIRKAEVFVLDDDLASAISAVAEGRPSSIQDAHDYARAPNDLCWFEWSHKASLLGRQQTPGIEGYARNDVKKVGMLVETFDDGRRGRINLAWSFFDRSMPVELSLMAVAFDYVEQVRSDGTHRLRDAVRSNPTVFRGPLLRGPKEAAAIAQMMDEVAPIASPLFLDATHCDLRDDAVRFMRRNLEKFHQDWEGETVFFKALLIMLNTKNGTVQERVNPERASFARHKSGKQPLLVHRIVRLRRSVKATRGIGHSEPGQPVRAHLVRGHFKTRSSGVFWWSPFVRGDANVGTVTHEYRVSA